jgi:hypothetical protein
MKQNKFPPGWDEKRVQSVISYYERQTEDEAIAEAEAGLQNESITLMEVPTELVPVVSDLIAQCKSRNRRQNNKTFPTSRLRSILDFPRSKEWASRWVHHS